MEEHIIASGIDLYGVVEKSNNIYTCRVSGGIGIKKNGYILFKDAGRNNVFISIRKISGNGKYILSAGAHAENKTVFNWDKVFVPAGGNAVKIGRPADAIGDISALFIGCMVEERTISIIGKLKNLSYSGLRVVDDKIIANPGAYIEGFNYVKTVATIPENCYVLQGRRVAFPVRCILIDFEVSDVKHEDKIVQKIRADQAMTPVMNMIESSSSTSEKMPPEAAEKHDMPAAEKRLDEPRGETMPSPEKPRKIVYDSSKTNFGNVARQFGGFRLLNNKTHKVLSLYPSSEVKIPFAAEPGNGYYCVEIECRSGSRSLVQFYMGMDTGILLKKDQVCTTTLKMYGMYYSLQGNKKPGELVIGVPAKAKDAINIHSLKVVSIPPSEFVSHVQKFPELGALVTKEDMKRSVDLSDAFKAMRLNVSQEDKMAPLSMDDSAVDLEGLLSKKEDIVVCFRHAYSDFDLDMFCMLLHAYDIDVVKINHHANSQGSLGYLAVMARNMICSDGMFNDVRSVLSGNPYIKDKESILGRLVKSGGDYREKARQLLLDRSFVKPDAAYAKFLEENRPKSSRDVRFKIVIPSYNTARWIRKTLESVASQAYGEYDVCVIDDFSTDPNQKKMIQEFCEAHDCVKNRWMYIFNTARKNSLYNIVAGIDALNCTDNDVVVNIDGDDWLYDEHVLEKVNKVYVENNVYMTYGQYTYHPGGGRGHCKAVPQHVAAKNQFRTFEWNFSHLRTYKYRLFRNIDRKDFTDNSGKFYTMAGDLALMIPMAELSGGKIKFIDDLLYVYNRETPLNDDKVDVRKQLSAATSIRRKQKYTPIV